MLGSTSVVRDWQPSTGILMLKAFGWPDYHPLHNVRESLVEAGIEHHQVKSIIGPVRINRGSGIWPTLSSISGDVVASGSPLSDALPQLRKIFGSLQVADGVILPKVRFVRGDVSVGATCSLPDLRHIHGTLRTTSASNLPSLMTVGGGVQAPYTPLPNLLFIGKGGSLGIKRDVPLLEAAGEGLWFWASKSSTKAGVTVGNHGHVISLINALRDLDLARLDLLDSVHQFAPGCEDDEKVDRSESLGLDL